MEYRITRFITPSKQNITPQKQIESWYKLVETLRQLITEENVKYLQVISWKLIYAVNSYI